MENEMNKKERLKFLILKLSNFFIDKFLCAGLAYKENVTASDVDPDELKMGIEVEYEHTTSKCLSTRIALDHLAEIPDYYTRLKRMEEEAFNEMENEDLKVKTNYIRSNNSISKKV
jgi:hypothetical protein